MQQKMNQWKASRMCASIEAETASPEQQEVFTKATGHLGASENRRFELFLSYFELFSAYFRALRCL